MGASKTELWTQLANAIKIFDQTFLYGSSNSPNLATLLDTLQQSYEGTHISATQSAATSFRSSFSSLLTNSNLLQAMILELARNGYNSIATTIGAALDDIYHGMVDASETVTERNFTYGAITPYVSNIGSGTVYTVTKDKSSHDLESGQPVVGTIRVKIATDRSGGRTLGNEEALLYGVGTSKVDEIELGTAASGSVSMNAKRAVDGILTNPSFETVSGSGATFAATGWTLSAATNFASETTTIFRKAPGLTTGKSLRFLDNGNILQNLGSVSLDLTKPTFLIVRFYRETACDGNLTIRLGSQTEVVALVAQSGWTDLTLGIGSSAKGWYDVFKEDNSGLGARCQISLASRTVGTLLVDEIVLAQPIMFSGLHYLLVSGATDFLKGDYFTFVDSAVNTGRIQYWLARLFSKHLPHTSGAPTYPDA